MSILNQLQIKPTGKTKNVPTNLVRKPANFDFRYVHYVSEKGAEVNSFMFSKRGIEKLGVNTPNNVAQVAELNGETYLVVTHEGGDGFKTFFNPAKTGSKHGKGKNVTIPTLVETLSTQGLLEKTYAGSQHFDLNQVEETAEATIFKVIASEEAPKAYAKGE